MVLGLLVIAGIPTTIGVSQAISAQKKENAAAKETAKFHMVAELSIDQRPAVECWVVLVGGRVSMTPPLSVAGVAGRHPNRAARPNHPTPSRP